MTQAARYWIAAALFAAGFGLGGWAVTAFREVPAVIAPDTGTASSLRFLAVGRQGYEQSLTQTVANAMEAAAAEAPTHGVFYLGDNFYPSGVTSVDDPLWLSHFEERYDGPFLRGTRFFAVPGNHDHKGNVQAEVQYAAQRRGSGRWQMDGLHYARDFGSVEGRVLVRAVFLDGVRLDKTGNREFQMAFARQAFAAPGNPIWRIVVAHVPVRSLTRKRWNLERLLGDLLPEFSAMRVDLYVSGDDWFQQILDRPGEPLHVSTSGGGGGGLEQVAPPPSGAADQVAVVPGFAVLEFDKALMHIGLRDEQGRSTISDSRSR